MDRAGVDQNSRDLNSKDLGIRERSHFDTIPVEQERLIGVHDKFVDLSSHSHHCPIDHQGLRDAPPNANIESPTCSSDGTSIGICGVDHERGVRRNS